MPHMPVYTRRLPVHTPTSPHPRSHRAAARAAARARCARAAPRARRPLVPSSSSSGVGASSSLSSSSLSSATHLAREALCAASCGRRPLRLCLRRLLAACCPLRHVLRVAQQVRRRVLVVARVVHLGVVCGGRENFILFSFTLGPPTQHNKQCKSKMLARVACFARSRGHRGQSSATFARSVPLLPALPALARRTLCAGAAALPWEPTRFKGANIAIEKPVDDAFEPKLMLALDELREAGRRGVWMRVPIEHSAAAAVAARHGFAFHHAEGGTVQRSLLRGAAVGPGSSSCVPPTARCGRGASLRC